MAWAESVAAWTHAHDDSLVCVCVCVCCGMPDDGITCLMTFSEMIMMSISLHLGWSNILLRQWGADFDNVLI